MRHSLLAIAACIALPACSASSPAGPSSTSPAANTPASGAMVFERAPIDLSVVEFVVPIGNLNPPDHTLPTDHAYFYHRLRNPGAPRYDVVAPSAGTVRYVTRGNDDAIGVQVTATTMYYLGHVIVDSGWVSGASVALGQHLGTTSQLSYGLDLGVLNEATTVFFVNPQRYGHNTLHAESPVPYFAQPLRDAVYAKIESSVPANNGRIEFDRAGRLAGNWFLDGLAASDSGIFGAGSQQLAFVRDVLNPGAIRISVGGTLAMSGVFAVDSGAVDPADVTPASGTVAYRLFFGQPGGRAAGLLLVQMLDDASVRAEIFPDLQDIRADFTPAARTYVR